MCRRRRSGLGPAADLDRHRDAVLGLLDLGHLGRHAEGDAALPKAFAAALETSASSTGMMRPTASATVHLVAQGALEAGELDADGARADTTSDVGMALGARASR